MYKRQALKGLARLSRHAGRHIISTPLEHSSVSGTLTALQEQGYEIDPVSYTHLDVYKRQILSAFLICLTYSIDDFMISYFNCGTVETLPLAIYSMTRKKVSPEIYALSTIMFVAVSYTHLLGIR